MAIINVFNLTIIFCEILKKIDKKFDLPVKFGYCYKNGGLALIDNGYSGMLGIS